MKTKQVMLPSDFFLEVHQALNGFLRGERGHASSYDLLLEAATLLKFQSPEDPRQRQLDMALSFDAGLRSLLREARGRDSLLMNMREVVYDLQDYVQGSATIMPSKVLIKKAADFFGALHDFSVCTRR